MESMKERMIGGAVYDPLDAELKEDRIRVRQLLQTFNRLPPDYPDDKRLQLLRQLFGSVGDQTFIQSPVIPVGPIVWNKWDYELRDKHIIIFGIALMGFPLPDHLSRCRSELKAVFISSSFCELYSRNIFSHLLFKKSRIFLYRIIKKLVSLDLWITKNINETKVGC